ncbi:MAG: glycosyl transferase family 1, partial [Mesorhizobium sp.]
MLHVLYLVHDVSDPAVRRRIIMLKAGGAQVTLAGFRRIASPVADVEGLRPIDLG